MVKKRQGPKAVKWLSHTHMQGADEVQPQSPEKPGRSGLRPGSRCLWLGLAPPRLGPLLRASLGFQPLRAFSLSHTHTHTERAYSQLHHPVALQQEAPVGRAQRLHSLSRLRVGRPNPAQGRPNRGGRAEGSQPRSRFALNCRTRHFGKGKKESGSRRRRPGAASGEAGEKKAPIVFRFRIRLAGAWDLIGARARLYVKSDLSGRSWIKAHCRTLESESSHGVL